MDVYSIRSFQSASQFLEELGREINELEDLVKSINTELESIKPLLERYKKLQELLKKFSSGTTEKSAPIEITGLQLYIDPSPITRYEILEESYRHMVDTLSVLKKVREVVQSVVREGGLESLRIFVQYKNGIPVKLIVLG
ncbi:MAG: hypothetical protein QXK67_03520 [Pyrobaculum sp.]